MVAKEQGVIGPRCATAQVGSNSKRCWLGDLLEELVRKLIECGSLGILRKNRATVLAEKRQCLEATLQKVLSRKPTGDVDYESYIC